MGITLLKNPIEEMEAAVIVAFLPGGIIIRRLNPEVP
jgi:hypothetical protein